MSVQGEDALSPAPGKQQAHEQSMNVASTRPCSLCAPASGHSEYMEEHIDGEQCRSVSASKLCVVVSVQVVAEPSSGGWQHSHSQRFGGSAIPIQCLFSSHILRYNGAA